MSGRSDTLPRTPAEPREVAAAPAPRPLYWSVRRELWEHRSVYLAPPAVAAFVMLGFFASTIGLPARRRALLLLDPAQQRAAIESPYDVAALMMVATWILVAAFYCLDALHGERRDRSILFWKSLPVSDLSAVLAKAIVPLVILPLIAFGITLAMQLLMLLVTTGVLLAAGPGHAALQLQPSLLRNSLTQLYGMAALALWHAPGYAWLLLVSGWARRAPFLWAVLPLLVVGAVERLALGGARFGGLLQYRLGGAIAEAFVLPPEGSLPGAAVRLTPGRFLSAPGLWIGLALAALFLAAAVRLRRRREPI